MASKGRTESPELLQLIHLPANPPLDQIWGNSFAVSSN
ncbi:hypothetical protein EIELFIGP_04593 [Stenotrophomonas maltophilia]|nr:hypothetical protein EIELFIGP_04593 [Stenotrophomonas maltophilia]